MHGNRQKGVLVAQDGGHDASHRLGNGIIGGALGADDAVGGIARLLEKGLQRIVYVDEFVEEAARELRDRREGYEDTMREVGLLPRAYDLAHLRVDDLDGIEGIVASRAETARALMRRLLDDGMRVPVDFQLIAGSGEENGREGYAPLTVAEFSYRAAAEYAVRAVMGLEAPKAFVPSPTIIEGKTTR